MNYLKREPVRVGGILTGVVGVAAAGLSLDPKLVGSLLALIGIVFGTAVRGRVTPVDGEGSVAPR